MNLRTLKILAILTVILSVALGTLAVVLIAAAYVGVHVAFLARVWSLWPTSGTDQDIVKAVVIAIVSLAIAALTVRRTSRALARISIPPSPGGPTSSPRTLKARVIAIVSYPITAVNAHRAGRAQGGISTPSSSAGPTIKLRTVKILAILTVILSVALLVELVRLHISSILFLLVSVPIAVGAFLVVSRAEKEPMAPAPDESTLESPIRVRRVTFVLFFLLIGISLLLVASEQNGKPVTYYVVIAAMAAVLLVQVAFVRSHREVPVTLGLIALFGLSLAASDQISFPLGIGGSDSNLHLFRTVLPVLQTGYVPPQGVCSVSGYIYQSFPDHHLLVVVGSLLLPLAPPTAYYTLGFLVMLLPVVVVFLVCRKLFGTKAALLAALLLSSASYYVFWASHAAAMTFAIPLVALIFLAMIKVSDRLVAGYVVVGSLGIIGLVFTHPYSTGIFAAILAGALIALAIVRKKPKQAMWGGLMMALALADTVLIRWSSSCAIPEAGGLVRTFLRALTQISVASPGFYDTLPPQVLFINTVGDSILLGLAVFGFFLVLTKRASAPMMVLIGPTVVLLVLAFMGLLGNFSYLLPNRIYVYLQVISLAPFASFTLHHALSIGAGRGGAARKGLVLGLVAILIAAFAFTSAASTVAGFETSPFTGNQAYTKLYNTQYEIQFEQWGCQYLPTKETVETSRSFNTLWRYELRACLGYTKDTLPYWLKLLPPSNTTPRITIDTTTMHPGQYVLFSQFDTYPGFASGVTTFGRVGKATYLRLSENATTTLSAFDVVYDSGSLQLYYDTGYAG